MSKFVRSITLHVSPDSLDQGEQSICQELALQLYAQNIFTSYYLKDQNEV